VCLIKHRAMPMCGEVEVQLHTSLPSVPEGGKLSVLCPVRLNPGEGPICWVSEPEFALEQAMLTQRGGGGCSYSSTLSVTSALELGVVNAIPRLLYTR
jgi:hypothetical protein